MGRLGSHPHIVTVFDLGEEQGQLYMVTELMAGGDVEGSVEDADGHRLPLEQAVKIAQETCRGMEFAHGRGIVHRDLKPGNGWLTDDGIAKIGDLGLAVVWTGCGYSDALRERDTAGDREKAVQLLDESLAISSEMGMGPLMERVLSRREILKA